MKHVKTHRLRQRRKALRKRKTTQLVTLLICVLVITYAAMVLVFHVTMTHHIESNAKTAIDELAVDLNDQELMDWLDDVDEGDAEAETDSSTASDGTASDVTEDSTDESSGTDEEAPMASDYVLVDNNYKAIDYYLSKQLDLVKYCKAHKADLENTISPVHIKGRDYYLETMKNKTTYNDGNGWWIVYVDVTSETSMVRRVDYMVLITVFLCGILAAYLAIRLGRAIEDSENKQKVFFENASHELKTPLMSIQGYAEYIRDGVDPEGEKHAADVILKESDRMAKMVEDILTMSRIESGQIKLLPEPVSVPEVVNNCLLSLEVLIRNRNLTVETNLGEATVVADPSQLETAILNLLSNAVKYADSRITVVCGSRQLTVWNDGGQVSDEDMKHVFDRFYIGPAGSTGIGLALTREIVTSLGWTITAKKEQNGVLFTLKYK